MDQRKSSAGQKGAAVRNANRRVEFLVRLQTIAQSHGGECRSEVYLNAKTKMEFRCAISAHPSWWSYPQHVLNGHWCARCAADANIQDLTARPFGRLIARKHIGGRRPGWLCDCACGKTKVVRSDLLLSGHTQSCGCLQSSHTLPPGESAMRGLFRRYAVDALRRGLQFELTIEAFRDLTSRVCHYCGTPPSAVSSRKNGNGGYVYNGIDRQNTKVGYISGNTVTCCKICNRAKADLDTQRFENWISQLVSFASTRVGQGRQSNPSTSSPPFASAAEAAAHICNLFCDGQDGRNSECARARAAWR